MSSNNNSELINAFKFMLEGSLDEKETKNARYQILSALLQKPFLSSVAHKVHEEGNGDIDLLTLLSDNFQDDEKIERVLNDIFSGDDIKQIFKYQIMPLMAQILKGELPASSFLDHHGEQRNSMQVNSADDFYTVVIYDKDDNIEGIVEKWKGVGRSPRALRGVIPRDSRDQQADMKAEVNKVGSHTGLRNDEEGKFTIYSQSAFSQLPDREEIQRMGLKGNQSRMS